MAIPITGDMIAGGQVPSCDILAFNPPHKPLLKIIYNCCALKNRALWGVTVVSRRTFNFWKIYDDTSVGRFVDSGGGDAHFVRQQEKQTGKDAA
jgi:hypothetical protein